MSEEQESWLPNLVGGVSIWRLASDLNEEQFFDGRLLVPDTEGSDSLPVRVTWDLTSLVPLPEARTSHPAEITGAIEDFFQCLERTARVFEKGGSGYDKYKQAFTMPALDADDGAHYFYDPKKRKLCVINWGASPRKIKHSKEYLFGYQNFGTLIEKEEAAKKTRAPGEGLGAAAAAGAVAGAAAGAAAEDAKDGEKKDDEKKEEKKDEEQAGIWGKPWWMWLLYLAGLLFLIWLAIALLYDCGGHHLLGGSDDAGVDAAIDAGPDGGVLDGSIDGGDAAIGAVYGPSTDDAGPRATELHDAGPNAVDSGSRVITTHELDPRTGTRGGVPVRPPRGRPVPGGRTIYDGPPLTRDGQPYYGEWHDPSGGYYYWTQGPMANR